MTVAPFVDAAWLAAHPAAVLADVRWYLDGRDGRAAYEAGHLPGAVFVALEEVLAGPGSDAAGRHPLPDPAVFAAGLAALGISDRDTVVAYDDDRGAIAARLIWLLRATGHDAALLNGGLDGWDGPLEQGTVVRPAGSFTAVPWPEDRLADIAQASDPAHVVLDARAAARFAGAPDGVDPRPGHIPGSRNLPSREHVADDGRLLAPAALRARFEAVGVTRPPTRQP